VAIVAPQLQCAWLTYAYIAKWYTYAYIAVFLADILSSVSE